jgi:hypothetical protein
LSNGINLIKLKKPLLKSRVLWCSEGRSKVIVMNSTNSEHLEFPYILDSEELISDLQQEKAFKLNHEPDQQIMYPTDEYITKHVESRDSKWEMI